MRLVVAATPNAAVPTIEALLKEHDLALVTQPDRPAGRGNQLRATEIASYYPEAIKIELEGHLQETLKGADLLITIGYGRLLSKETLSIPKFGGINLHFSLLPRWRGAAPVQRAIEAGDKVSGVTVFQMDEGMDTGPIWNQKTFPIPYGFSSRELFDELSILGAIAVKESLSKIVNGEQPEPQTGETVIAKKIQKSECIINWQVSADEIIRKIKAFSFNPGVHSTIRGEKLRIEDARLSETKLESGELASNGEVGTAQGSIQILEVTPAGKRTMGVKDWLNGFKPIVGERFDSN
jgi:methionyl-tRNA formyltransferase